MGSGSSSQVAPSASSEDTAAARARLEELRRQLQQLSVAAEGGSNKGTAPKEGCNGGSDNDDSFEFVFSRITVDNAVLTSPNSLTLDYKANDGQHDKIVFGVRGSTVGMVISMISKKNALTGDVKLKLSHYHFGLLLSGNDYTLSEKGANWESELAECKYMLIHLIPGAICISICNSMDKVEEKLASVWASWVEGEKLFKSYTMGHSVLSVRLIANFINREKRNEVLNYEFAAMKSKAEDRTLYATNYADRLPKMTNCFIFVIRFIQLLNVAARKESSDIPNGDKVIKLFDKNDWKDPDAFKYMWDFSVEKCKHGLVW